MSRPKWVPADTDTQGPSAQWSCLDLDCELEGGGHGGEKGRANVRRSKAAARTHSEETGHPTAVYVTEGWWGL